MRINDAVNATVIIVCLDSLAFGESNLVLLSALFRLLLTCICRTRILMKNPRPPPEYSHFDVRWIAGDNYKIGRRKEIRHFLYDVLMFLQFKLSLPSLHTTYIWPREEECGMTPELLFWGDIGFSTSSKALELCLAYNITKRYDDFFPCFVLDSMSLNQPLCSGGLRRSS